MTVAFANEVLADLDARWPKAAARLLPLRVSLELRTVDSSLTIGCPAWA